jgi:hypothetical protein
MRQIVRASLPLGQGVVLDPFMGAGSTIAAAMAVGYESIGIEHDATYFEVPVKAIPVLAVLKVNGASSPKRRAGGKHNGATKGSRADSHPEGSRVGGGPSGRAG